RGRWSLPRCRACAVGSRSLLLDPPPDVVVHPLGEDASAAAVLDRADLAGHDEALGLGDAIAEHLRDLGYRIPLASDDCAHGGDPSASQADMNSSRAMRRCSRARAAADN